MPRRVHLNAVEVQIEVQVPLVFAASVAIRMSLMGRLWLPDWPEEDREIIDLWEEEFRTTTRSAEELRAEAKELRQQAAERDRFSGGGGLLALAEGFEQAAAARERVG